MNVRPTEMISGQEIEALKAVLDRRRKDHTRLLALLVVLCCGLRKEEVRRLVVGDLRPIEGRWCLVPQTAKQRKAARRVIPIIDDADVGALQRYIQQEHGTYPDPNSKMFLTAGTRHPFRQTALTDRFIDYNLKKLREAAGVNKRVTAHSFRHSYATRLLRSGADLRTVQELMGHRCIASTERYLRSSFGLKVEAMERLSQARVAS